MTRSDINTLSVEERISLMEELWASFERDRIEYPTPAWHREVLTQRMQREEKRFVPFEKAKRALYEALDAYKDRDS